MFFIYPIGIDHVYHKRAWVTISLIALCALVWLLQLVVGREAYWPFLTHSTEQFRPWQLLTSAFMHGGFSHLFGNMLILWAFGRYAEERLGHWRFLSLYVLLAVASDAVNVFVTMGGLPSLGASGAIAGICGLVMASSGRARVQFLVFGFWLRPFSQIFKVAAWLVVGFWFAGDFFVLAESRETGVAVAAHVGGLLAGIALGMSLRLPFFERSAWYLPKHEHWEETQQRRTIERLTKRDEVRKTQRNGGLVSDEELAAIDAELANKRGYIAPRE